MLLIKSALILDVVYSRKQIHVRGTWLVFLRRRTMAFSEEEISETSTSRLPKNALKLQQIDFKVANKCFFMGFF